MSTTAIQSSIPSQAVVPPLTTTSPYIMKRRNVEIPSTISGDYSYNGNSEIVFSVNSASDFIDFSESYVRLDLKKCSLTCETVETTLKSLAEGGIHSLFKEIEVRTANGVVLSKLQRYNKLYSHISSNIHSMDHIDTHKMRELDSSKAYGKEGLKLSSYEFVDLSTVAAASYTDATKTITVTTNPEQDGVSVGDILVISYNDAGTLGTEARRVASITATTIVLDTELDLGADLAATEILQMRVSKEEFVVQPARQYFPNVVDNTDTNSISVSFQPFVPLLQSIEWLPLFLIRGGLEIRMVLDRPDYVLSAPQRVTATDTWAADIVVKNCYYVASFVSPNEQLANQYLQLYKSQGLSYGYLDYSHNLNVLTSGRAGSQSLKINSSARSVRHILFKIQDKRAESVQNDVEASLSTYTCDSIAQALKGGLEKIMVEVGSEVFPLGKELDLTDKSNGELLYETQRAYGLVTGTQTSRRHEPYMWSDQTVPYSPFEQGNVSPDGEPTRLNFAINMSRDSSAFSSTDARLNPIMIKLDFGSSDYQLYSSMVDANRSIETSLYIHTWSAADAILSISESGTSILS
jgi:hypothetical protein